MYKFGRSSPASVDREAGRIRDPLERLRYLRKEAPASLASSPGRAWRITKKSLLALGAIGLCGVLSLAMFRNSASAHTESKAPPRLDVAKVPSAGPPPDRIWLVEASET